MIAFRQLILPGDVGADVLAVKHTLRSMDVAGAAGIVMNRKAGPAFVETLRSAQREGGIGVDGKYGPQTHGLIAPHFSAADEQLYASARIRPRPQAGPAVAGDAAASAQRLLELHAQGRYRADNPRDLGDVRATADGRPVTNASGRLVHIDGRVMRVLVHLIEHKGHTIGTFALCSDHHDDGPNGHAGGKSVDISSIDGKPISSASARAVVLQVDRALHHAGQLVPRQLISGGVGNVRDEAISRLSIPGADAFFGAATMRQHCNHIHVGY